MPLTNSSSDEAVGENIEREKDAGKPQKQAVAIALDVQRRAGGKSVTKSEKKSSGDWQPLPDEFMADVAKCSQYGMKKSIDDPGDSDNDEVDSDIQAAASTALKSQGGEGSRGGNVTGHTAGGKPIYGGGDDEAEKPRKYPRIGGGDSNASVEEGGNRVSQEARDAKYPDLRRSHHGPAGGGGGIGNVFGGNAGAGFQQGAGLGTAVGSEAASGQMSAPTAVGHAAVAKIGQAATPKAPGVASQPGQSAHGAGGSMGVGAQKSTGCAACKAGTCKDGGHEMEKALTSRSIAIPVYMRQAAYDPDGTFRSATTQTSRMYTGIAPPVAETLAYVADSEDVRTRRAVADLKRSQEIADMRIQMLRGVRERGDRRHFGE